MTKKKWKDYQEYLESDEWQAVKDKYKRKNKREYCTICFNKGTQHHHWQYAKDWTDDSHKNIILVCDRCHTWLHNSPQLMDALRIKFDMSTRKKYLDVVTRFYLHSERLRVDDYQKIVGTFTEQLKDRYLLS